MLKEKMFKRRREKIFFFFLIAESIIEFHRLGKLGRWKFRSYLRLLGFWYLEFLFPSILDEKYKTVNFF
jgi:hypothetical protein